jgi:uncharacterized repeat protein (TIGR02543 family)
VGESHTLTATALLGWVFDGWTVTNAASYTAAGNSVEVIAGTTNIIVTANFTPHPDFIFELETDVLPVLHAGSITPSAIDPIHVGETHSLTAVSSYGWAFDEWIVTNAASHNVTLSAASGSSVAIIVGTDDINATAVFTPVPVSIAVQRSIDGAAPESLRTLTYEFEDSVTITALAGEAPGAGLLLDAIRVTAATNPVTTVPATVDLANRSVTFAIDSTENHTVIFEWSRVVVDILPDPDDTNPDDEIGPDGNLINLNLGRIRQGYTAGNLITGTHIRDFVLRNINTAADIEDLTLEFTNSTGANPFTINGLPTPYTNVIIAADDTETFTVSPRVGLLAGGPTTYRDYAESLRIYHDGEFIGSFTVTFRVLPELFTLTVDSPGSTNFTPANEVAPGAGNHLIPAGNEFLATINTTVTAGIRPDHRVIDWRFTNTDTGAPVATIGDNGLVTLANPLANAVTFTMPAHDVTATARWVSDTDPEIYHPIEIRHYVNGVLVGITTPNIHETFGNIARLGPGGQNVSFPAADEGVFMRWAVADNSPTDPFISFNPSIAVPENTPFAVNFFMPNRPTTGPAAYPSTDPVVILEAHWLPVVTITVISEAANAYADNRDGMVAQSVTILQGRTANIFSGSIQYNRFQGWDFFKDDGSRDAEGNPILREENRIDVWPLNAASPRTAITALSHDVIAVASWRDFTPPVILPPDTDTDPDTDPEPGPDDPDTTPPGGGTGPEGPGTTPPGDGDTDTGDDGAGPGPGVTPPGDGAGDGEAGDAGTTPPGDGPGPGVTPPGDGAGDAGVTPPQEGPGNIIVDGDGAGIGDADAGDAVHDAAGVGDAAGDGDAYLILPPEQAPISPDEVFPPEEPTAIPYNALDNINGIPGPSFSPGSLSAGLGADIAGIGADVYGPLMAAGAPSDAPGIVWANIGNPLTSDEQSFAGLIASSVGLLLSSAALFVIVVVKKRKEKEKEAEV